MDPYLSIRDLHASYGKLQVLNGVDLEVEQKEIALLIGHNGAGKSTVPKVVFGLLPPTAGHVTWRGQDITGRRSARNVADGMALVPQGRGVFSGLSIDENLRMGCYGSGAGGDGARRLKSVYELFPALAERRRTRAGALSGGQQRMLSIGIALMAAPELLFIDEPSIGLSPVMVQTVMEQIARVNSQLGTTIVLIEQNVRPALAISHRVLVLKQGRCVLKTTPAAILERGSFWDLY